MTEVRCQNPDCGKMHLKALSEVNRALKKGRGMYCCRTCCAIHANKFLGRTAKIIDKKCVVCGAVFQVKDTCKARRTCSDECADYLRYRCVSPEAKERRWEAGRQHCDNALPIHEILRLREAWKYVEIKVLLDEMEVPYQFEEPIGPYIVDLVLPDQRAVIEFDGRYHQNPEIEAEDMLRDADLSARGWKVFRILTENSAVIPSYKIGAVLDSYL